MIRKSSIAIVALSALGLAAPSLSVESSSIKCEVRITEPNDGQAVGGNITIRGTATISPDLHLWAFVRRVKPYRTADVWWTQGEITFDPTTPEKWEMPATIGNEKDVGYEFDVAVAAFNQAQHIRLLSDFKKTVKTRDPQPDQMPPAACIATRVTVKKTQE
jgi:hypothetical protein